MTTIRATLGLTISMSMILAACGQQAATPSGSPAASATENAASPNQVLAQTVPTVVMGNKTCSQLAPAGETWVEIKVDPVRAGTYTSTQYPNLSVTVSNITADNKFHFTVSHAVSGVFVKGGPNGNLYTYNPPVTSGSGLHAPTNPNNNKFYGLSHISFCFNPKAIVSGMKFHDRNANGTMDTGDVGLAGWQIQAFRVVGGVTQTTAAATTTTGADGRYSLSLDPGTYVIRETQQTGWHQSTPADTATTPGRTYRLEVTAFGTYTDRNFGNYQKARKSGMKFHDRNANGVSDAGDEGLAGWTIYVDYNRDGVKDANEPSAVTGADGTYTITEIQPGGPYDIREVMQTGWHASAPTNGFFTESFTSGEHKMNNNFGNFRPARKTGMKFHDRNANGRMDTGEMGLAGWTIYVDYNRDGMRDANEPSAVTGADGRYEITGIRPGGPYDVREVMQGDWIQSHPAGGFHTETFTSGQVHENNDFGNYRRARKSGVKFNDLNNNGVRDAGEPGLANWTITLVGSDGMGHPVSETRTTDASGAYSFTVNPGSYTVCETQQTGWNQTYPRPGAGIVACAGGTLGYAITLLSGDQDTNNDFGNHMRRNLQGCTPGYWKQSHHFGNWTGYSPNQSFNVVFGVSLSTNWTLLQALDAGGGDVNALARHAVAALLNAASSGVEYRYTEAEIKTMVRQAIAGTRDIETVKNLLATENERGCPLGRAE